MKVTCYLWSPLDYHWAVSVRVHLWHQDERSLYSKCEYHTRETNLSTSLSVVSLYSRVSTVDVICVIKVHDAKTWCLDMYMFQAHFHKTSPS